MDHLQPGAADVDVLPCFAQVRGALEEGYLEAAGGGGVGEKVGEGWASDAGADDEDAGGGHCGFVGGVDEKGIISWNPALYRMAWNR